MSRKQQRAEHHHIIWKIANDPCGCVDGWNFKQGRHPASQDCPPFAATPRRETSV
jgi:hypothetical protein